MTGLLEFVSALLGGVGLLALAVAIGGVAYVLVVLRSPREPAPVLRASATQTLRMISIGAGTLAILRLTQLILKPLALADVPGELDLAAFMRTQVFQFGASGILFSAALAVGAAWLRREIAARIRWGIVLLVTGLFLVNEAWLSHATSRVEGAGALMAVTVVHLAAELAPFARTGGLGGYGLTGRLEHGRQVYTGGLSAPGPRL